MHSSADLDGLLQGVDGEMQVSKRRRRRALLQDGKHSPNTQFDMGLLQQTSDATEPCTESIMCAPEWEEVAHGVVSIYAINTRIRALGLCTGAYLLAPRCGGPCYACGPCTRFCQ